MAFAPENIDRYTSFQYLLITNVKFNSISEDIVYQSHPTHTLNENSNIPCMQGTVKAAFPKP